MDFFEALESVEKSFYPVALTMPRISALFLIFPLFSGQIVTGALRGALIGLMAIYMSPFAEVKEALPIGLWLLIAAKEALIGALLGLALGLFIWAVQSVGELIDFQTGSSNASFFDPASGHETGPTGQFLYWLAIVLFVSAGGLLGVFVVLADSFRIWPILSFFPDIGAILPEFVIREGSTLLLWIIKLASPIVLILLLVEVGMGLINRFIPQLNVFVFSQPLKGALALFMMALFLHFLYGTLQSFLGPNSSMLQFLRHGMKAWHG